MVVPKEKALSNGTLTIRKCISVVLCVPFTAKRDSPDFPHVGLETVCYMDNISTRVKENRPDKAFTEQEIHKSGDETLADILSTI